jgi:hypothetical protein
MKPSSGSNSDSRTSSRPFVESRGMVASIVSLKSKPLEIDAIKMHSAFSGQSSATEIM